MKKIVITLPICFLFTFIFGLPAYARNDEAPAQQQNQVNEPPQASGVREKNETTTQNQGEETQLQVTTQDQVRTSNETSSSSQIRNQKALESMSQVAEQVQLLLQVKTPGGIGEQIRDIAQEQNTAQTQIQTQLSKLESKTKIAKFLTGTDFGSVKQLKTQLEQNQLRIQQLEQLHVELTNQGDAALVTNTIQALIAENTALQEKITAEEQTVSLFGWLFKLFSK